MPIETEDRLKETWGPLKALTLARKARSLKKMFLKVVKEKQKKRKIDSYN